ncbi:hypothetical protein GH714_035314 [Hevea brasiliensis]|uniref:Uncharacterized protein n=1 Tax=Hevea brasiliensis TaxID=3981 RepID=A0A6A6KEN8_HEVBR|nr:hypothetical protein GH714_035314 [Hevea brasiliensis]
MIVQLDAMGRPDESLAVEVRHLPLDELELASLRGTIQRMFPIGSAFEICKQYCSRKRSAMPSVLIYFQAEIQLNLQKRRGHGVLSVLRPKFSDTVEKTVLEQTSSRYELQGEYVLPGTRDRSLAGKERGDLFKRAMTGQLGSVYLLWEDGE